MSRLQSGLLLILLGGLCCGGLLAYERGDFAPRGALLYTRIADTSDGLKRLAGDDWKTQAERMLLARTERDVRESEPVIAEIRSFIDYLGTTEFIIGDIMIRDPYIQSATVVQLKEGAPKTFSEAFREWAKDLDDEAEVKEDSVGFEGVRIWLKANLLIISTGGMMEAHVQDVIDGYTDESLSKVERFTKWSARAKGDIVLFADMKAWRAAIDRLGEDFDADVRRALEVVEWQKWDLISGVVALPGKTGGLAIDLNLSLNQPFSKVNAFLKPSGGSRLVNLLPSECVGFVNAQLGREHEATYTDLLRFFHDFEQDQQPANLRRRLEWRESDLKYAQERLTRLQEELKKRDEEKDKDESADPVPQRGNSAPVPVPRPPRRSDEEGPEEYSLEQEIEDVKAQIEATKADVTRLKAELEGHKYREFQGDREARKGKRTEAEEFHDEVNEILSQLGFTREEALAAIGQEVMAGILNLPDPGFADNDLDDAYQDLWFVMLETAEGWPEIKEKLLDRFLARKFPEDMPEEAKEDFKRNAAELIFKEVEGGELVRMRGLSANFCVFGGEGFVGVCANEDVALRIMKAGLGQGRLSVSNLPGGTVAGSKFAYVNLREVLGKIARGDMMRDRRYKNFPDPYFDLEKYMPAGMHFTLASDEASHGVTLSARQGGEANAASTMRMFADEIQNMLAHRHDQEDLSELAGGINAWQAANAEKIAALSESERARAIKAVNPAALIEQGIFSPQDGMRSAFDPAMAPRFKVMLEAHLRRMGPATNVADDPTDLAESSYEWLGLPPDLTYDKERGWQRPAGTNPWIVCQLKGDWARGGRLVLMYADGVDLAWLTQDDMKRLREATSRGEIWQPADPAAVTPPAWRMRRQLAEKSYEIHELARQIQAARQKAIDEGREFKLDFKGGDGQEPMKRLREMLGISEEDWFHFQDAGNLTLKTDSEGKVTARFEKWGQWIELTETPPENEWDPPFKIKSSMDD